MKFFPSSFRVNQRITAQPSHSSQADHQSEEPSDTKEILLLSAGLLILVFGIGGLLMYTEEGPNPATASQSVAHVDMAKAFSSPTTSADQSASPPIEDSFLLSDMETQPTTGEPSPDSLSVLPSTPTLVSFGLSQTELTEESKSLLGTQVAHLPKDWNGTLHIQGHTDTRGSESYNRALGAKRAEAVKTYLVSLGIPQDRIQTDSVGKDAPLCQEDSPACHEQNRRAEVKWLNSPVAQGEEPVISMTAPSTTEISKLDTTNEGTGDVTLIESDQSDLGNPNPSDSPILEEPTPEFVTNDVVVSPEAHP